jgi:putative DNA primase/helicase
MTSRPTPLPIHAEAIPESLRAEHRWVVWNYVWIPPANGKPGRWTKPPYVATAQEQSADSTDPRTWRSFGEALGAYKDGKSDGIGFVLGDGWVGFDGDHTDAPEFVDLLDTYTERSPSGEGVHCICRGTKPGPKCRTGDHELYDHGRYLTVTGHHVTGTPTTVEERTPEIATLYARLFPERDDAPTGDAAPTKSAATTTVEDDALIALAFAANNGAKFKTLWMGDTTGYDSHSEADMAFCGLLAFWTNRNAAQMDRLFRRSGLMRPKWDERRGDSTIGADLIAKAIANTPTVYTGKGGSPQIIIRRASDVPVEKPQKAFGGRLVRGSFGLLSGPGEAGKGMFLMDTIARFTTGNPFPGETARRPPATVLICVVEDSMGVVSSRLRAAGADLDKVLFVEGPEVIRGGLKMPSSMMLDDDAGSMVRHAKEQDAKALFLETAVEHFGDRGGKSRRSTNNEVDVRSALSPFRAMCDKAGLYGLGAIHPNKTAVVVDNSISGSAAFRNVARAVHHIYRDPEDEAENPIRLLFTSKTNYMAQRPSTLRFQIRSWDEQLAGPCQCNVPNCEHEGRVIWETDLVDARTAEEIWQQIADANKPRRDVAVQEAEKFLKGLMQDGKIALLPQEIFRRADDEGITKAAVKRAKANLGLVSKKEGFPAEVVGWQEDEGEM